MWYEDLFHVFLATFSHLRTNPVTINSLLLKSFHLIFGCADWFSRKCILPLCNDLSGICHLWYKSQRRCAAKGVQWESLAQWEERPGWGQAEAEGQRRHNVDSCWTHSAVRPGASDVAASGSASSLQSLPREGGARTRPASRYSGLISTTNTSFLRQRTQV